MARYQYRKDLDFDDDTALSPDDRVLLRAALDVAIAAHEGQSRDKSNTDIKYISHPIMVYEIMRKLGERDPITLAGALLHDSLEKDSAFHKNPLKLRAALREQHVSRKNSNDITRLVMGLTNPEVFKENKEVEQIERVKTMSFAAKKIKIIDQAASLVCNLTMANNHLFTAERERGFTDKAHTLAIAIVKSCQADANEAEEMASYEAFFGHTMNAVQRLLAAKEQHDPAIAASDAEAVRDSYDVDVTIAKKDAFSILPIRESVHGTLNFLKQSKDQTIGLATVDFNSTGRVLGYTVWARPSQDITDDANRVQDLLKNALRKTVGFLPTWDRSKDIQLTLQPGDAAALGHNADGSIAFGRKYSLYPPLHYIAFCSAMRKVVFELKNDWNQQHPSTSLPEWITYLETQPDTIRDVGVRIEGESPGGWLSRQQQHSTSTERDGR